MALEGQHARIAYLPQLDGLRAVAVVVVFLYHAKVPLFARGGYLGVDVFFVLSGYLITTLLVKEHELTGDIALKRFYLRRIRRLAPVLVVVAVSVAVLYVVLPWAPVVRQTVLGSIATLGQVAAWPRAFDLGNLGRMGHAWSLSVEEHFYLVWPALVVLVMRRWPGRSKVVLGAVAVAVIAYGNIVPVLAGWSFDRSYNAPDTRASDILIGCLLALTLYGITRTRTLDRIGQVGGAAAAVVLGWWTVTTVHRDPLYSEWGIVVVVAAALIVFQLVWAPTSWLARVLSNPVLVWIGLRSYGIYLIHLPVIGLVERQRTVVTAVVAGGATLVLSAVSYRFLETPLRRDGLEALRRWVRLQRRPVVAGGDQRAERTDPSAG